MSDASQNNPGNDPGKDKSGPAADAAEKAASEGTQPKSQEEQGAGKGGEKVSGTGTENAPTKESMPQEAKAPAAKRRAGERRKSRAGIVLVVLLLVVAGGAGSGAWYLWQRLQHQNTTFTRQLGELQSRMQQVQADEKATSAKLENRLQSLQKRQRAAQSAIEVLRAKTGRSEAEWRVAEAEYLIRIASYRLTLERDVGTALIALTAADGRLRSAGDPALLQARKQLADDIQALRSVKQPDLPGLSLTLSSVIKQIDKLPLNTPAPSAERARGPTGAPAATEAAKAGGWRGMLEGIWHDLRSLVVIHHTKQRTGPLLAPKERFFLTENLRLQLEQARLALMRGDSADYHGRITTAQNWIRSYFDTDSPATEGALQTLTRLGKENINPTLPDVSDALRSLKRYREELHGNRAAVPAKATPGANQPPAAANPAKTPPPAGADQDQAN